jgi:ADP-ribose pyrophosphatase YjhB (NUDIX family)
MGTQPKNDLPSQLTLCVGAVVLREAKVLFVRQAYGGLKGKWSLPWGFVDSKNSEGQFESPDKAAARETQEEAGIIAQVEGLLGVQNDRNIEGEQQLYILFLCHHVSGEPTPDNRETDRAAYFSADEMADFNEPFDEFCEWVARRVLEGQHHLIPPLDMNPYQPHLAFL